MGCRSLCLHAVRHRRRCRDLAGTSESTDPKTENGREIPLVEDPRETADELDSHRAVAPLRAADDAMIVETDGMSVREALGRVLSLVQRPVAT